MNKEVKEGAAQCRSLKQARLPFKVLDIKSSFLSLQQRKRKLPGGEDACKVSKSPRSYNSDNIVEIDLSSNEDKGEVENMPELVSSSVKCYVLDKFITKSSSSSETVEIEASAKVIEPKTAMHVPPACLTNLSLKENASEVINHHSGEHISTVHSKETDNFCNKLNSKPVMEQKGTKETKTTKDLSSVVSHNKQNQKLEDGEHGTLETLVILTDEEHNSEEEKMDTSASSHVLSLSDLDKVVSDESFKTEIAGSCKIELKSNAAINCSFEGSSPSSLNCSIQSTEGENLKSNAGPTDKPKRKKRKMSEAEAKQKALARDEKQKEKEDRKMKKQKERTKLQLLKQEIREKMRQEKEQEKLEAKTKREQEKKEKKEQEDKEKEERLRQKLAKRELVEKERMEKIKEKEEKRQQKMQLLSLKSEEKKKKEEDKLKKLDEKKKAEEEEERKREKEKAAFASFFVKASPPTQYEMDQGEGLFRPFQVTKDMTLAPIVPFASLSRFSADTLDAFLESQDFPVLYLKTLKTGQYVPFRRKRKIAKDEKGDENDIIIVSCDAEKEQSKSMHPKLLQFTENVRPPYWGTWRKKSTVISSRRPFACDQAFFDYDVDSDEEWDEGGPGESLSATEDEKESDDDYEVDNEFFVPHGYLSSDEEHDDEGNPAHSPETQRERLKMRAREFEAERNQKCSQLKPTIIGCFWTTDNTPGQDELKTVLKDYCAIILTSVPIMTSFTLPKQKVDESNSTSPSINSCSDGNNQKQQGLKRPVPEEAMPYLIEFVHANTNGRHAVVREFQEFWQHHCQKQSDEESSRKASTSQDLNVKLPSHINEQAQTQESRTPKDNSLISKRQLEMTLHKISVWCKCPSPALNKFCWWVHEDVREKYGCTSLPVPSKYVLRKEPENLSQSTPTTGTPSIKKFVKKIVPIRLSGPSKAQCALPFNRQHNSDIKTDRQENVNVPSVKCKIE